MYEYVYLIELVIVLALLRLVNTDETVKFVFYYDTTAKQDLMKYYKFVECASFEC